MDTIKAIVLRKEKKDISGILNYFINKDKDEYVNMLGEIIMFMEEKSSNPDIAEYILKMWDKEGDADQSFLTAVENFVCTDTSLRYIVETVDNLSSLQYMLSQIIDSNSFGQVVKRLLYAYDTVLTNDDLVDLKEYLDMYENRTGRKCTVAFDYIQNNMEIRADIPSWVSLREGENRTLFKSVSLGESLQGNDVYFKDFKDTARKMLSSVKNLDSILDTFISTINDTSSLDQSENTSFRVWGPENRFHERDCSSNPDSTGPCRMLECMCKYDQNEIDWFTKKCDSCSKKILNKSHAIRYPCREGGWEGCFCCFDCMNIDPTQKQNTDDNVRLKLMKDRINQIGIMDRSLV